MKILVKIIKAVEMVITAIWGIIFGIFAPIALMGSGERISGDPILWVWVIHSAVYIVGTIIVMLKCYRVALGVHFVGLCASIYIYAVMQGMFAELTTQNPAQLYMPIILLPFLTLAIAIIANKERIERKLSGVKEKDYAPTPSILGGQYEIKKGKNDV